MSFAYPQCGTWNTFKMIYVHNTNQYVEYTPLKLISCETITSSKYFNFGNILVGLIEVKTWFNSGLHVFLLDTTALIYLKILNVCYKLGYGNTLSCTLVIKQLLMGYIWTVLSVLF